MNRNQTRPLQYLVAPLFVASGAYIGMALLGVSHSLCAEISPPDPSCYARTFQTGFWIPVLGATAGYAIFLVLLWIRSRTEGPRP